MYILLIDGGALGQSIAEAIRGVIVTIVDILTPVIDVLGVGMLIVGALLALGLRQEFLGVRMMIAGGMALATLHLIVPMLLGFL